MKTVSTLLVPATFLALLFGFCGIGNAQSSTVIEAESMSLVRYQAEGSVIATHYGAGQASKVFSGPSGTYRVDIYVVGEREGSPSVELFANTRSLGKYQYPWLDGARTYTIASTQINSGETLKLAGESSFGASALVDKIVLTPLQLSGGTTGGGTTTPPAITAPPASSGGTASGTPITVEAEAMTLSTYRVEGGLIAAHYASGQATTSFGGASGNYRIDVYVVSERVGSPTIELRANQRSLGTYQYPWLDGARVYTIASASLSKGDLLQLYGTSNFSASALVDKIVLTPLSGGSTTTPPVTTPPPTTTPPTTTPPTTTPPATGNPLSIEAETMSLSRYQVEGSVIATHYGAGRATKAFTGSSGTYKVDVYVVSEKEGSPSITISANSRTLGSYQYPWMDGARVFTIASATINNGETIAIDGTSSFGASALVDKIVLTPTGGTSPGGGSSGGGSTTPPPASGGSTNSRAVKYHPGNYAWFSPGAVNDLSGYRIDVPQHRDAILAFLDTIKNEPTVRGIQVTAYWRGLEGDSAGDYSAGFASLDQILARAKQYGKYVHLNFQPCVFGNYGAKTTIFPAYIANNETYGTTALRSLVDGTFKGLTARTWQQATTDRIIALTTAYGARYNSHPNFEMITFTETSMSVADGIDGFSNPNLLTQFQRVLKASRAAFPNTGIRVSSNDMGTDNILRSLFATAAENYVAIGGPDVWPNDITVSDRLFAGYDINHQKVYHDYRDELPAVAEVQWQSFGGDFTMRQLWSAMVDGYSAWDFNYYFPLPSLKTKYFIWYVNQMNGNSSTQWYTGTLPFIRSINGAVYSPASCPTLYPACKMD